MMNLKSYIEDIILFMRGTGFQIDPLPKILIEDAEVDPNDLFIKTGHYNFNDQSIVLFTDKRHLKDILRSFCHEMVHHNQFLRNSETMNSFSASGKLEDNPQLKELEREAYEKGNLLFRWYTETK